MNEFQGVIPGQGILKEQYPSAAYQALKKRRDAMMMDYDQEPRKESQELSQAHEKLMTNERLSLRK